MTILQYTSRCKLSPTRAKDEVKSVPYDGAAFLQNGIR